MNEFKTTRFGTITFTKEDVILFPDGPLGFPDTTKFVIVDDPKSKPFRMLQSIENSHLAFTILDPKVARQDYKFNINLEDLKYVESTSLENLEVYCVVSLHQKLEDVTINLQGPIVINTKKQIAHQYVLVDQGYTTREKVLQQPGTKGPQLPKRKIL